MQFMNLLLDTDTDTISSSFSMIIMMAGMFAIMYFMMIRPQKKRQAQEQEMRNAIDVGDEITTIGGICGRVVTIKEAHLIIETGADRNRMQITRWAVQANETANARVADDRAKAQEAKAKAKGEGKKSKKEKLED
ncbi:MAG: preprotein translocase subunit YajC [Clostridia bacterium]